MQFFIRILESLVTPFDHSEKQLAFQHQFIHPYILNFIVIKKYGTALYKSGTCTLRSSRRAVTIFFPGPVYTLLIHERIAMVHIRPLNFIDSSE